MKRKDVFKFVLIIFWVFIIGSMIGYGVETIVAIIQNGHFASRQSLLYGPLIPVYGVGLVAYYLVISKIKDKGNLKIFIITMVLGGIVEYLFSFFQEKFFGTVSWDYSNLWFNIKKAYTFVSSFIITMNFLFLVQAVFFLSRVLMHIHLIFYSHLSLCGMVQLLILDYYD